MAGNMDSLTESLTCPICFEEFEENGDHVPRLLPCTHSLCHTCIGQWIRNNRLECLTCRIRHDVRREGITFPQNKYILTMMRRRTRLQGEEMEESRRCMEHGQNEILFCRETGCQKTICTSCLSKGHLGHKVVAIKDETEEVLAQLLKNIEISRKKLNAKIKNVEEVSQDATRKTEESLLRVKKEKDETIQHLERKKQDIIKQYDEMIKQAEDMKHEQNETSANELAVMTDNEALLTSIKQSIEEEENTYEDAQKKLDTVKGVTDTIKQFPRVKKYKYSEYVPGQEHLVGKLMKKEKYVIPTLKLRGQVRQNFATGFVHTFMNYFWTTTLNDGTVVVNGMENNQYKLKRFSLETGRELSSVNMNNVSGMTEVNLGVNSVIAVSDTVSSKIEFRNRENLNEVVLTHSVAPHQPGALCSVSSSVLVYEDTSKNPPQLHWLDCSEMKPKPLGISANSNFSGVWDMYVEESESEKLLIAISYNHDELIHAYDSTTGQLVRSIPKRIPRGTFDSSGVAGDGNGRIFVADNTNFCIQMFSASDGQYLGCLLKNRDQGFGYLRRLRWSEASSSLVVVHYDNSTFSISDIH